MDTDADVRNVGGQDRSYGRQNQGNDCDDSRQQSIPASSKSYKQPNSTSWDAQIEGNDYATWAEYILY